MKVAGGDLRFENAFDHPVLLQHPFPLKGRRNHNHLPMVFCSCEIPDLDGRTGEALLYFSFNF